MKRLLHRNWRVLRATGLVLALLALGPAVALAASSEVSRTDQTEVRLVSAATAVGDRNTVQLGLHFRMQPGWKVYWRSPGPGGFPPVIDWAGSENLANAQMAWPAPLRFSVLGFETLGYKDEVVYPLTATLAEPGKPVRLQAHVRYLTCSEICVPYETDLRLELPAGPAGTSSFAHLINRFAAQVPQPDDRAGLTLERVTVEGPATAPTLRVTARARDGFSDPDLFVEGPQLFEFSAPRLTLSEDGSVAVMTIGGGTPAQDPPLLAGKTLTLTLVDGDRATESLLVVEPGAAFAAPGLGALLIILGLALLGGLILNLMPCVLPVLSIKLLGVVSHGGGEPARVRLSFLATAAGIIASFLVLAGATIAIKAAGVAVGWGIQFQQPAFLVAIMLVLTVFAANIWGLFEFRLPGAIADLGAQGGRGSGLAGDFLTGAFATLLATPCTAPFLGTAVGFALARGPLEILLVFTALGVGLALPYFAVAALPRLATALPAPGPWMLRLKQILALALVATVIWLLTVLTAQAGVVAAAVVGGLMVGVVLLLWRRSRPDAGLGGRATAAGIGLIVLLAFAAPAVLPGAPGSGAVNQRQATDAVWRPFERAAIPLLVAQGKTVFVDVTADWCITCQANKSLVLTRGDVAERLRADDVVAMVADWTRPDEQISAYLAAYGRYGIPFNIVYGPGAAAGVPLPELLSKQAVLEAFGKAAGPRATAARD